MMNVSTRETFESVLLQNDSQVLVRQLLMEIVPAEIQAEIVRRYNQEVEKRWKDTGYSVTECIYGDPSQR
jgi:hypothetical protein